MVLLLHTYYIGELGGICMGPRRGRGVKIQAICLSLWGFFAAF